MFKSFSINLTGPICKCDEQDLTWVLANGEMHFKCNKCKVKLVIPHNRLYHHFTFDTPYPGASKKDNIIPFNK